jgi:hypothetical protein
VHLPCLQVEPGHLGHQHRDVAVAAQHVDGWRGAIAPSDRIP